MTQELTAAKIEKAVWIAIYGGLFLFILGLATGSSQPAAAWFLAVTGAIAVLVGVVLIWMRSRIEPSKGKP